MALSKTKFSLPLSNIPPIQLWICNDDFEQELEFYLLTLFCINKKSCKNCTTCIMILKHHHPSIVRLSQPYTLESLEPIKNKIGFILESDELYFFIIPFAEKLLPATANALLKSLEEPPKGYHFILQTNHQEAILPTVLSRSVVFHFEYKGNRSVLSEFQFLYDYFTEKKIISADIFLKLLETSTMTEQEASQLLSSLLLSSLKTNNSELQIILLAHLTNLEHTTNIKLLWKNLFLQTLLLFKPVNK